MCRFGVLWIHEYPHSHSLFLYLCWCWSIEPITMIIDSQSESGWVRVSLHRIDWLRAITEIGDVFILQFFECRSKEEHEDPSVSWPILMSRQQTNYQKPSTLALLWGYNGVWTRTLWTRGFPAMLPYFVHFGKYAIHWIDPRSSRCWTVITESSLWVNLWAIPSILSY